MSLKTADLCDEFSSEIGVCHLQFESFGGKASFSGKVSTVEVFEDNVLVRESLESAKEGSVIVVNGGGSRRCALLGDRLGEIAVSRGVAGIIINGCVRDSSELKQLDLGVFALGTMPLKSNKKGEGKVGVPVKFGGVMWSEGDYVYADEDGIVISDKPLALESSEEQMTNA
ncbi:ribonuclease E activity regulator RraA [Bacillus solimangrovi]|uniref:4-hydroxy-4-methyl-2-oxoglutarate aldolase n=1 Tax=Bacillus solimangrovi TaxID=1305675 RepID=A0A1E5LFJ9_9BACI|nr:ribonuclease E activity regulator RraA [Bacillus solimangrovi]OEH92840.1 ribonuclease [Bacillus solimangrovi]